MMKFLWLISLWIFSVFPVNVFAQTDTENTDNPMFFNALIEVAGKTISGIMVLNEEDSSRFRMLFTTIAGPKLLDMYITEKNYDKIYCIKQLDRKIILRFFQKDFSVVTGLLRKNANASLKISSNGMTEEIPINKKDTVLYFLTDDFLISKTQYISKKKPLFEAVYHYDGNDLNHIVVQQLNFNMRITLNRFE